MTEIIETPLRGKVKVQSHFPIFGVVELHEPYEGLKYAAINDETVGRDALLNLSKDGNLPVGQEVVINKASKHSEGLVALDVAAVVLTPFEQFSKDIENISLLHTSGRILRFALRVEYWRRRYWTNVTFPFKWVGNEGVAVGNPIEIYHMTLHDMMEHEAQGVLTGKVLLEGMRVNAIQRLDFKRLDKLNGMTTIQPRWV